MKKNIDHSQNINRISRRDNLPLLRGMFVVPGSALRKFKTVLSSINYSSMPEDELFLTADKGYYLGE